MTDVPLSRKCSSSDQEGIQIQIAEVLVNMQGGEQGRNKLHKQEMENYANTWPFPDLT